MLVPDQVAPDRLVYPPTQARFPHRSRALVHIPAPASPQLVIHKLYRDGTFPQEVDSCDDGHIRS